MAPAAASGQHRRAFGLGWPLGIGVGLLAAATVALIVVTGSPVGAVLPVGIVGLVALLCAIPLRYPGYVMLFLGLTLESQAEIWGNGLYKSPIVLFGWLMQSHMNVAFPQLKPLAFSGMEVFCLLFTLIAAYRRASGSRIDGDFIPAAAPLRSYAWTMVLAAVVMEGWGFARGGADFGNSLWQIEHVVYLPLFFYVFHICFRGPRDQIGVGKVIIAAAITRAVIGYSIRQFVQPNDFGSMPVATTHSDSMLFAAAFCLCITLALQIPGRRYRLLCLFVLPILLAGMRANNRRIVWIEIGMSLAVVIILMPWTPLKRKILRYVLFALPFVIIYLIAGWNSQTGPLRGANMIRSLVDSKSDASTEWRDNENIDLIASLQSNPVLGLGFGQKYIGPAFIEDVYPQEHFLPHDSMLGIWAFGGIVGFTLYWLLLSVGGFLAARTYAFATRPIDRVAALFGIQMILIYANQGYGDIGFGTTTGVLLTGVTLAMIGKLAMTTGAWPWKTRRDAEAT